MQNPSGQPPVAPNTGSSVPISLYKEVTAELQNNQQIMAGLQAQNQDLFQQNQVLRRELERIILISMQLQQAVNTVEMITKNSPQMVANQPKQNQAGIISPQLVREKNIENLPRPVEDFADEPRPPVNSPFIRERSTLSENLSTEEKRPYIAREIQPRMPKEVKGIGLIVMIFLIVFAAFGTGYFFVRPMLKPAR
ncbi:MAG: hypothetical protein ACRC2J_15070 [Microcoleaceae cyanobacterium]